MSDLVLSNLTIQGHPVGLFCPDPPPTFDEVTIGNYTWTTKNLDIDDGQGGVYIRHNVTANGVNYGTQYYYTLAAAQRIANNIPGWHLPDENEIGNLALTAGGWEVAGGKLKSTTGWNDNNGTDDYGFNSIPVGYYPLIQGADFGDGDWSYYWFITYNQEFPSDSSTFGCRSFDNYFYDEYGYLSDYAHQVRLVKDY